MERYEPQPTSDHEEPVRHDPEPGPQSPMPGEHAERASEPAAPAAEPQAGPRPTDDTHSPEAPASGEQRHDQGLDSPLGPRTEQHDEARVAETRSQPGPAAHPDEGHPAPAGDFQGDGSEPLLAAEDAGEFNRRWESIQIGFVDEPRQAVQDADALVAEVIRRLADGFSDERARLEGQWGRGEDVATDELRLTLQRYRSFFHRLLST